MSATDIANVSSSAQYNDSNKNAMNHVYSPLGELENRFYFGLQLGLGIIKAFDKVAHEFYWANRLFPIIITTENKSFSGRIYAGYQLKQYFGAELGYVKFSNSVDALFLRLHCGMHGLKC